jgi:hypothetical protein
LEPIQQRSSHVVLCSSVLSACLIVYVIIISIKYIVASCSLRLKVKIIVSTELRTLVLEAIKARATMTDSSHNSGDDIHLEQVGID